MEKPKAGKAGGDAGKIRTYFALALVGVAVVLLVAWLASGDNDSSKSGSGEAEIVSTESLRDAVAGQGTPVYWAGERRGAEIELSRPGEGRTYLRYLTGGAKAGDPPASFLPVGPYAPASPVAALRRQGKQSGEIGRAHV